MRILAAFLIALNAWSATVTVCASGCTTTSLQTALDTTANCGDTISIKSTEPQANNYHLKDRGCASGTPITVTTDRAVWLPFVGTRITPSHLANMAIIRTNNTSPALDSVLTAGVPAKHWKFIGIAFSTTAVGGANPDTYSLVDLVNAYVPVDSTQLPDDITFDRCYFYTGLPNGAGTGSRVTNAIIAEGSNFTVKNSFFGDFANPGQEAHDLFILTTPGPVSATNNLFTVSGIPIFSGGAIPYFPVTPANISVLYNYMWRPWKWLPDPSQPYYADFLTNGSYTPCLKNLGEFKFADTVTWKYNGHENIWSYGNGCQSQFNGFTHTIRTAWESTVFNATMGTMSFIDTTHVQWSSTFNIPDAAALSMQQGRNISSVSYGVCPNVDGGVGIICRPFSSYNNTTKIITVSTPFPSAYAGNFQWWISYDGGQTVNAVSVENNIYKNISKFMSVLGTSAANGLGNNGRLMNSVVRNNLVWNPSTYMDSRSCFFASAAEEGYATDPTGYLFSHNTCYSVNPYVQYVNIAEISRGVQNRQPKFVTANLDNNIAGPSVTNAGFQSDSHGGNIQTGFPAFFSGSTFRNNGMPGIDNRTCAPETCTGNLNAAWVDPFANSSQGIFVVKPGHPYAATGTEGLNLGVDFSQLPLIKNVKVNGQLAEIRNATPTINTSKVALLEWDLSGPIQDAGATQPCVVEVSTSQDLHNDLHTYAAINALRPDYFFRPDSTASTNAKLNNPVVANAHVSFPIGKNATVADDNTVPVSRDLSLLPNTIHYGRAMCYGDTVQFWFRTAVSSSAATSFNVSQIVPAAADHYRISYGTTAAFGTNLDVVNATPAATTTTVPISADTFVYWKPTYRASGVQIGPVAPVTYIQVN